MMSTPEETASASASAGPSPQKKEAVSQAMQLLASGKRNLLVGDVPAAVAALADACEMLGVEFGEGSVECAEPLFYYGKALLELARMESGVIDNVPTEDSAENSAEEEDEEEEEKGEEEEKAEENGEGEEKSETAKEADEDDKEKPKDGKNDEEEEEEDENDEKEDGNESIGSTEEAGTSNAKEKSDISAIEKEDEEDPSNLQLAWEVLELAKNCFQKHADSLQATDAKRMDLEAKLSETYQTLGEVSIENENYPQAIDDLTSCLRRRQEMLPEDSRVIAETHYQLGVALGFNLEFDKAVEALNDAIHVLEKRIQNLKDKKESEDPVNKGNAFCSREKEISEIESLIPEIREKIADTKDMQEETVKKLGDKAFMTEQLNHPEEVEAAFGESSTNGHENGSSSASSSKRPVQTLDISHMVKKRKKPEEEKVENGNGHANGDTNGTPSKKQHVENGN